MSITRVAQSIKSGDGSNFDHSKASDALNVPAGALIVVKFSSPQAGNILTAPTDTAGNTYVKAQDNEGSNEQTLWYCLSATANAANVVTSAFSGGCSEYGYSVEVYTGAAGSTWSYDAANSGIKAGAYSTSPTVTPSLSTSGAGIIATCLGQYNDSFNGSSASQSPGSIVNSSIDTPTGTTCVMASGEVINTSAFSGTITGSIQQSPAAYTKCDLLYASFLSSGGGSSNSAAGTSSLGALSASASVSASNASTGVGTFAKLAAAGSVALAASLGGNSTLGSLHSTAALTAANGSAGTGQFGAITSNGSASARASATAASTVGPLASAGGIGAAASTAGVSTFGRLVCSGTIPYTHQNTLAAASAFGAFSSAGSMQASQALAGSGQIGGLLGVGTAPQHTSAVGVSALGGLLSSGTIPFQNFNTLSGVSLLGPIGSGGAINASQSAAAASTFAPLACRGTIPMGVLSLPADPLYYVQMPPRWFYAALTARPFYILSDPNMTPSFSPLDPRETEVLTFDASADLANEETLTTILATAITVQSGPPTSAPPTLTGQVVNGAPVTLMVNGKSITIATGCCVQVVGAGGVSGTQYLIAITCATTNPDKVLTLKGILPISAQ